MQIICKAPLLLFLDGLNKVFITRTELLENFLRLWKPHLNIGVVGSFTLDIVL